METGVLFCYEGLWLELDGVTGVMLLEKGWFVRARNGFGGLLPLFFSLYFMMCFLVSLVFSFSICSFYFS